MAWLKRYKLPLLLILLLPQVVNLLCCWMLSGRQLREIPTVVYMGDNSALTRQVVQAFDNHETFDVVSYAETPEAVPEQLRLGKAAFGLVIPRHFTEDLTAGKAPALMTVVDGSQLSAASFTKIAASEILLGIKQELLTERLREQYALTADKAEDAVSGLVFQSRLLGNPTRNYLNFLLPGMMTALVQVGLAMTAAAASEDRSPGWPVRLAQRVMRLTGMGLISLLMVLAVQTLLFGVPVKGGLGALLLLSLAFSFAVSGTGALLSALFRDPVLASQAAAVWFIPSTILSGYTWPLISMPSGLQALAWLMPYTHYGDPLRDLLLKGHVGGLGAQIGFLAGCGLLGFLLALGVGKARSRWNEGRAVSGTAA